MQRERAGATEEFPDWQVPRIQCAHRAARGRAEQVEPSRASCVEQSSAVQAAPRDKWRMLQAVPSNRAEHLCAEQLCEQPR